MKVWQRHAAQLLTASLCLLASHSLYASASFELTNANADNEGFNDTTVVAPVGGNTGTTRGAQRLIAFNTALNIISQTLSSDVPIQVSAEFNNLGSTEDFYLLAAAGPKVLLTDFTNAPKTNTWYVSALANRLAGEDLAADEVDIDAQFDTGIDTNLIDGVSWYYGLDGQPASNQFDFITVALHEIIHGLGFISTLEYSITNEIASADLFSGSLDSFSSFLQQHHGLPPTLSEMTSAQRGVALTATDDLQWSGRAGQFASFGFQNGVRQGHIQMYAPEVYEEGSSVSHNSLRLTPNDLMEPAYTGVQHNLGLGAAVLSDIGWGNYTDVVVAATLPVDPVAANVAYTLQIHVVNNGAQEADDTSLSYTLPSNTTLQSIDTPQGSCNTTDNPITCDLGSLSKRASITLNATLITTSSTDLTHNFSIQSDAIEANIDNNQSSLISHFSTDTVDLTAEAGNTIQTLSDVSVTLTGSSNDNDANYQWTQLSGPSVTLNNATSTNASFSAPTQSGVVLLQFAATNTLTHTASDTVSVIVNHPPIADAGSDQVIYPNINSSIQLHGEESSDDDASTLTYAWQQTSGTTITLSDSQIAAPTFSSPGNNNILTFQLTVTDASGASASDSVQIEFTDPIEPTVNPFTGSKKSGAVDEWLLILIAAIYRLRRCQSRIKPAFQI
jgi:hypothetical protein